MSIERHLEGIGDITDISELNTEELEGLIGGHDIDDLDCDLDIDDSDDYSNDDYDEVDLEEFDEEDDIDESELELDDDDIIFTEEVMDFEDDEDEGDSYESFNVSAITDEQRKELKKLLMEEEYVNIHGKKLSVNMAENNKKIIVDNDKGEKTLAEEIFDMKNKNTEVIKSLNNGVTGIESEVKIVRQDTLFNRLRDKYQLNNDIFGSSLYRCTPNLFELVEDLEIETPEMSHKVLKAFKILGVRDTDAYINFEDNYLEIRIRTCQTNNKRIRIEFDVDSVKDIKLIETVEVTNEIDL